MNVKLNFVALLVAHIILANTNDFYSNDCSTAISVTCGTNETGSTSGLANNPGLGTCTTSSGSGGVMWYTFTGDGNSWTFETVACTGQYDTKIWVFSGACGSLTCVTGNDDGGTGTLSLVTFTATVGVDYFVVVGGFSSNEGNYDLQISSSPCNPVSMSYTSGDYSTLQASTDDVTLCSTNLSDQVILKLKVLTSGSLSPLDLTQIRLKTDGSTDPLNDITNVNVYYTGGTDAFSTANLFGSAAPAASGTNFFVNGTQTLVSGNNYFWVAFDVSAGATVGNAIDARCTRITVDGTNDTGGTCCPGGSRTIIDCPPVPGGVDLSGLTAWFKSDDVANGNVTSWSTSYPSGAGAITLNDPGAPYSSASNTPANSIFNYNRVVDFNGNNGSNQEFLTTTTAYNLLQNQNAGNTGTFFVVYAMPATGNPADGVVTYKNGNHGIQMRGWGRLAIGEFNSTSGARDFTEDIATKPQIVSYKGNKSSPTSMSAYYNDLIFTNNPTASAADMWDGITFGAKRMGSSTYGEYFSGYLSETIFFNVDLTAAELNRVHSYLGVKYGITLDNSGGGTQGDYASSSGSRIWDASINPQYHNNVIGIGRDDNQGLTQKQSHSFYDTTRVYISTLAASNEANGGTFTSDDSYVVVGDDQGYMCLTPASMAEMPASCGLYSRIEREWKVTRTKMADDFSMDVKLAACAQPGMVNISHLRFLVDDDGDFSNGGTTCYYNGDGTGISITYNNPVITVSGINTTHIPDNQIRYVTIGSTNIQTPLPVELSDFAVKCVNGQAYIQWETASEYNNDFFTLERSRDNVNFDLIHVEQGSGSTSLVNVYSFIDQDMDPGTNYYRISQFDIDGSKEVLFTRALNCEVSSDVKLYPNPFGDQITITTQQEGQVILMDLTGKIVGVQSLSPGENILNTSGLAQAAYIARVILDNEDSKEFKLIKL